MRSTNKLFLRGYVGQEPKLFDKICKVSIGTSRNWSDKDGKAHQDADWVQVTVLNEKVAKWVADNVKKGDPVYCEARVRQSSYKKDGETIYSTDVIATLFDSLKQKSAEAAAGEEAGE